MSEKCAIILAGGKGTRLRPYTIAMPKPLVPVGDIPILEIIIRQLAQAGFTRIIITINHLADIIKAYFHDGSRWSVNIEYSLESKPLSTMGPLKNIPDLPENFLVMNGDVLTDLPFLDFYQKHIESNSIFTISSYKRTHMVDYGVLHTSEEGKLQGFEEKPKLFYTVSMGIYAASSKILEYIPKDQFFGFDNLMYRLLDEDQTVLVTPFDGYWMDIGRPDDYQQAIDDFEKMKGRLLS